MKKWNSRMDEYEFREPLVWFFQSKKSCLLDYHELPSGLETGGFGSRVASKSD